MKYNTFDYVSFKNVDTVSFLFFFNRIKICFRTRRHAVGSQDDPGPRCVRLVQQDVPPEEAGGRFARDPDEEVSLHLRHHVAR